MLWVEINDEEHIQHEDRKEQCFDVEAMRLKYNLSQEQVELLRTVQVTTAERNKIMSYPQRSDEWLQARKNRITASNFGAARSHSKYENPRGVVKKMLWGGFKGNAATRYGAKYEDVAAKAYIKFMKSRLGPLETFGVSFPNLIVSLKYPWAGVSPDGFVYDRGVKGGLEIKCPFKQTLYPYIPSMYYDQIQGTMGFLGLKFWDFVVWTPERTQIRRYKFDEAYWNTQLFPKLEKFYMTEYLPRAVLKQRGELQHGEIDPSLHIEIDMTDEEEDNEHDNNGFYSTDVGLSGDTNNTYNESLPFNFDM